MAYVSVIPPAPRHGLSGHDLGKFKFKKVFKSVKKVLKPIYRPIVAAVKPMLKPLVAMIPGVGPAAAIAVGVAQKLRMDAKAAKAVQASVQQASSWATLTDSQRQAILNAISSGVVPSIQAPPDVVSAYQQAIQQQASAHPEWTRPAGAPAAPSPMPWEAPPPAAAPAPGMDTNTMLIIGGAVLAGVVLLGAGRRR